MDRFVNYVLFHRVQNAKGKTSPLRVLVSSVKTEGVLALWQGMLPMYIKMAPHNIFVFIFFEQMQNTYKMVTRNIE